MTHPYVLEIPIASVVLTNSDRFALIKALADPDGVVTIQAAGGYIEVGWCDDDTDSDPDMAYIDITRYTESEGAQP